MEKKTKTRQDVDIHRIEVAIVDFTKDREPSYEVEVRINSKAQEFDGSFRKSFPISGGDKATALNQAREMVKNILTGIRQQADKSTKVAKVAKEIIDHLKKAMEKIFAEDIEVGMTVVNPSGDKFKVTKIEKHPPFPDGDGRIRIYDKHGERGLAGKKAPYYLVF